MSTCFDGAPIVACGDDNRVHAVHNTFVVSCGTIGVGCGECPRFNDPITDFFTGEIECQLLRELCNAHGLDDGRQDGENAEVDTSTCDGLM
jgi:hypothetical protein